MKILHLGDLHIGKKINEFSLINDQKYVLEQVIDLIKKEKIESILISGDIFDRAIPPASALELFGNFLSDVNKLNISCFIIAGNHDSAERLSYLAPLIKNSNIFISDVFSGKVQKCSIQNDIDIYLMPYLYPAIIRKYYPQFEISNYNDAIKLVVQNIELDKNKINIMLAHQFVGFSNVIVSDSEQKSVGGVDVISPEIFYEFDYTALGHLHCAQAVTRENIRYSGSILKYSFSEMNQKKQFTVLNINSKNDISYEFYDIKFLHDIKEYRGKINEFLSEDFYSSVKKDDYIHFILEDEYVIDAKKKLSLIYPNIAYLEFDNSFTRKLNEEFKSDISLKKSIFEHFCDFYSLQNENEISDTKAQIVKNLLEDIKEKEICDQ